MITVIMVILILGVVIMVIAVMVTVMIIIIRRGSGSYRGAYESDDDIAAKGQNNG